VAHIIIIGQDKGIFGLYTVSRLSVCAQQSWESWRRRRPIVCPTSHVTSQVKCPHMEYMWHLTRRVCLGTRGDINSTLYSHHHHQSILNPDWAPKCSRPDWTRRLSRRPLTLSRLTGCVVVLLAWESIVVSRLFRFFRQRRITWATRGGPIHPFRHWLVVIKETQKNCAPGLCSKFNIEQQASHRPICSGTHSFIFKNGIEINAPPPRPNNPIIIIGDKHCHHLSYKSLTFSLSHFLLIILILILISYYSHPDAPPIVYSQTTRDERERKVDCRLFAGSFRQWLK